MVAVASASPAASFCLFRISIRRAVRRPIMYEISSFLTIPPGKDVEGHLIKVLGEKFH